MPLNADALRHWDFGVADEEISQRDAMLYALTVGAGSDPVDLNGLRFVYEEGLEAFPTLATVVCNPGGWTNEPRTGITKQMVVHGGVSVENHRPIPIGRRVLGRCRIVALEDKGPKGSVITVERTISDADTGDLLATIRSMTFARADGGFGGDWGTPYRMQAPPGHAPDATTTLETRPEGALLYRLNGDYNPLHADPEVARQAGFKRPIHHGLGTFGAAAWALLKATEPAGTLGLFEARFSSPVYPGETLTLDIWRKDGDVAFRARVAERDVTVLDYGRAILRS